MASLLPTKPSRNKLPRVELISEFIERLKAFQAAHGDLPVFVHDGELMEPINVYTLKVGEQPMKHLVIG